TEAARTALARRTDEIMEPIVRAGESLRTEDAREAAQTKKQSDSTYRSTRVLLAVGVAVVLLLGLTVVLLLIQNMVPRIRRYSHFAADFAAGRSTTPLRPRGRDEAQELLQRHLERSSPDSVVAVLRRNNSAN
ncbi:MAG: hypothetical protein ABJC62_09210, partial [Frankiaceae bacterium]